MPQAIFVTKFPHWESLPTMEQLQYTDGDGVLQGGYSCIGHLPQPDKTDTCIVMVYSRAVVLTAMYNAPQYLFIARVFDEGEFELGERQYYIDWFDEHPVYKEKVINQDISTVPALIRAILVWHGVSREDLRSAGVDV